MPPVAIHSEKAKTWVGVQTQPGTPAASYQLRLRGDSGALQVPDTQATKSYLDGQRAASPLYYKDLIISQGQQPVYAATPIALHWFLTRIKGIDVVTTDTDGNPVHTAQDADDVALFSTAQQVGFQRFGFYDCRMSGVEVALSTGDKPGAITPNITSLNPGVVLDAADPVATHDESLARPYLYTDLTGTIVIPELNGGLPVGDQVNQVRIVTADSAAPWQGDDVRAQLFTGGNLTANIQASVLLTDETQKLWALQRYAKANPVAGDRPVKDVFMGGGISFKLTSGANSCEVSVEDCVVQVEGTIAGDAQGGAVELVVTFLSVPLTSESVNVVSVLPGVTDAL